MKTATFAISMCCFLVFLLGSAFFVHTQTGAVRTLELSVLEDQLYEENAAILSWSLASLDPGKLNKASLPTSWGEIMIIENSSLEIRSSSIPDHTGSRITSIPELLDEAPAIISAQKKGGLQTVRTDQYMITVSPLSGDRSLLGFKPRSWEQGLISSQTDQLSRSIGSLRLVLIAYLAVGAVLAIVFPLIIISVSSIPLNRASKSFERLSLGDFDAELDPSGGKTMRGLSDSFFRLKTSLKMALEKLGSR